MSSYTESRKNTRDISVERKIQSIKEMKKELYGNIDVNKIKQNAERNIPPFQSKKHKMEEMEQMEKMKKELFGNKYVEKKISSDQIGLMFHLKIKQENYIKQKQENLERLDKEFKEQVEKTKMENKHKNPKDVLYFEEPHSLNPELFEQELQVREIVKHLKSKEHEIKESNIKIQSETQNVNSLSNDVSSNVHFDDCSYSCVPVNEIWNRYETENNSKPKTIKSVSRCVDINILLEMEELKKSDYEEREQMMDLLR
jgi:hypothetical protein